MKINPKNLLKANTKEKKETSLDDLEKMWDEKEMVERKLQELWNCYAPYYKGTLLTPSVQQMGKLLVDAVVPCQEGIVHDAGCGIGHWLIPMLKKTQARKVIGTDYSQRMLDEARKKLGGSKYLKINQIELRLMDLTKQWPQEKFDTQIFHLLLYYLPYGTWKKILKKAFSSTKPGGYVYSSVLFRGFRIEKASKKYLLHEFFFMPLEAVPFLIKAINIIKKIDEFVDGKVIEYPTREEFLEYHKQIGFDKVEIVSDLLEGWGVIVKAQKPIN